MGEEIYDLVMKVNSCSVFLGCKYAVAQFLCQEPHANGHRGWIADTDGQWCGILRFERGCGAYYKGGGFGTMRYDPVIYVRR